MNGAIGHIARFRGVRRVLLVTLALNWLVAAAKLLVGHATSTLAMVADGYHSTLDGASNVVGLVAIYFAYQPPDEDHQYGHRKYETVSAMAIGVALFIAAYHVLAEALARLANPVLPRVSVASFAVMAGTILVNLGVSTYERRAGERLQSSFLLSDSAHTRSDVFASTAVIAALIAARMGHAWLDVVTSLLIAAIIVGIGYRVVSDGLQVIADQVVLDPGAVEKVVLALEGVKGCSRIRTRGTEDHVFMDLVCLVPGAMTMRRAHDLADQVEERIRAAYPQVKDIVVHLEPSSQGS